MFFCVFDISVFCHLAPPNQAFQAQRLPQDALLDPLRSNCIYVWSQAQSECECKHEIRICTCYVELPVGLLGLQLGHVMPDKRQKAGTFPEQIQS